MTLQLKAEKRDIFGKKLMPARKEGKLPAVVYGGNEKTKTIFVSLKEFKKTLEEAGESSIIELIQEGAKNSLNVVIKDVAVDPVSDEPLHVDFYKVQMDKPIIAAVPLVFNGIAPAVKEFGGILVKVMREIEIEALPKDLPSEIAVDISGLKTFEDRLAVSDIKLPAGVKAIAKPDEIIVLIEQPKAEEALPEERTIADIEVEKKGKKEEEVSDA